MVLDLFYTSEARRAELEHWDDWLRDIRIDLDYFLWMFSISEDQECLIPAFS